MTILRTVFWARQDGPGAEMCALCQEESGYRLEGTTLTVMDDQPMRVEYWVDCDLEWRTREVQVELLSGKTLSRLYLHTDDQRRWWDGERELENLSGCTGVDLEITPATHTLAIRRLALVPGDSVGTRVVAIKFPGLATDMVEQRYTRLEEGLYRYESVRSGFKAALEVDDLGLVVHYHGSWELVAFE